MSLAESTKFIVLTARSDEERKMSEHLRASGWSSMGSGYVNHPKRQADEYVSYVGMKNGILVEMFQSGMLCGDWQVVHREKFRDGSSAYNRTVLSFGYGLDKLIEELARRGV